MTALDTHDDETNQRARAEQLSLLQAGPCVRRYSEREILHDESCLPATASGYAGDPLERPLRSGSATVLRVLHAMSLRHEVATTQAVRSRLGLPEGPTNTRNVERRLRSLATKRGVIEAVKHLRKGVGRPARVWRLTPAGVAEMLTEQMQARATEHNERVSRGTVEIVRWSGSGAFMVVRRG